MVGRDARSGAAKKLTEAQAKAGFLELVEEQMGPVLRNGVYSGRCPKCTKKSAESVRNKWCPGADPRLERETCRIVGEHLHGTCEIQLGGCGFYWREECADVDDNLNAARRAQ